MYISCNELKKHIENSNEIDWMNVWNKFTIRSAEIDGIERKGTDIQNVVVGKILSLSKHPEKDTYMIAKVDAGNGKEITLISSATNLYEGMYVPCALPGGSLKGLDSVSVAEFKGVRSEGVLASEKELGISDKHLGVMDLKDIGKELVTGTNIKDLMPIDDIIIEIDNKSLTNRPDMWGQYGIAREVSAITGHKLLPLSLYEDVNEGKELDIKVLDTKNCNRYSAIEIENIKVKETNIDMKIMLYYCGMRSISLLVDLSNYLMLELGQPMHTFDATKIKNIVVKNVGSEKIKFTTLDGTERDIAENTLMICNGEDPVAIAGVMGGLNSEIDENSTSVILESANFNAASVRKSATAIGLRTEASARYEKSLDPNLTDVAAKRFIKLLKDEDENIKIVSKLTDVYCNKIKESIVHLKKDYLRKYLGFNLDSKKVFEILESLSFKVVENESEYVVTAPTYRSTKDISNGADIIEEISRIYGYENFKPEPLKLDLIIPHGENRFELEYDIKKNIASIGNYHEVHTYLWYLTDILEEYNMDKSNNLTVINKSQNNILRDDLSWSLFEQCLNSSKYFTEYGIFEIGTVMKNEGEERILSLLNVCNDNNLDTNYNKVKQLIYKILKKLKGIRISFEVAEIDKKYLNNAYTLNMKLDENIIGYISVFDKAYTKACGKKTSIINLELNTEKLLNVNTQYKLYEEPSKYQTVSLDYTIIMNKDEKYSKLEEIVNKFVLDNSKNINISYVLKDIYLDENKKTTIRFTIGSNDKTLSQEEIQAFKDDFISYIENFYNIVK